jgi:hypothetical protein
MIGRARYEGPKVWGQGDGKFRCTFLLKSVATVKGESFAFSGLAFDKSIT